MRLFWMSAIWKRIKLGYLSFYSLSYVRSGLFIIKSLIFHLINELAFISLSWCRIGSMLYAFIVPLLYLSAIEYKRLKLISWFFFNLAFLYLFLWFCFLDFILSRSHWFWIYALLILQTVFDFIDLHNMSFWNENDLRIS